jgi:O-acetyl-ADP-ribose deacetylase (regulator of RNase III)
MQRVQHVIMDRCMGEQPVGTAFVISTGDPTLPFVAHAPTMRVPGSIAGTDKIDTATWAALLAIQAHNQPGEAKIRTIAFPAMGTGFGGVSFTEAARLRSESRRVNCHPRIKAYNRNRFPRQL